MACFGSPTSTRAWLPSRPPKRVEKISHCTRSVSWNSSISTTENLRRSAATTDGRRRVRQRRREVRPRTSSKPIVPAARRRSRRFASEAMHQVAQPDLRRCGAVRAPVPARGPCRGRGGTARWPSPGSPATAARPPACRWPHAVASASAQAWRTISDTSDVRRASGSTAVEIPRVLRTWAAKLCMVEIATESNSDTARSSRRRQSSPPEYARSAVRSATPGGTGPPASASAVADHLASDARPELGGGGPGEGDDQQLGRGEVTLGQEPGGQRGQGERLAGAGTGLDRHLPGGQVPVDVEGTWPGHGHDHRGAPDLSPQMARASARHDYPVRRGRAAAGDRSSISSGSTSPKTSRTAGVVPSPRPSWFRHSPSAPFPRSTTDE